MIQILLHTAGVSYRAEVYELHCPCPPRCGHEPTNYGSARAIPQRSDSPRVRRAAVMAAVTASLASWSHAEFIGALDDFQETLPGL